MKTRVINTRNITEDFKPYVTLEGEIYFEVLNEEQQKQVTELRDLLTNILEIKE